MARNIGYAVIDLETTGLDKDGTDAIVEIAIVLLDVKGYVTGYYETIVKPNRKLGATNIHKINEAMIINAPKFGDIVETVASLIKGRKLVAHNAAFEANFLRKEMFPHDVFINENNFIDTLKLSRKVLKLRSYKLVSLTEYFQIPFFNAHTALSDTIALSEVFKKLRKFNKRETSRHVRMAKAFKYTGKISFDTSLWLPRNPDAFIQTYKPYQRFNIFRMVKEFSKPLPALRGIIYALMSLAFSWFGIASMDVHKVGALFLVFPLWLFLMYQEHRFHQRSGKRRNRSNKHQQGVSTVEESGGSVTFANEVESDTILSAFDDKPSKHEEDDFDEFLNSAEIPINVQGDMVVSLNGDDSFDAWADSSLNEVPEFKSTVESTKNESEFKAEVPIKVEAKPLSFASHANNQPSLDDLLKPVSLTEVGYKSLWRSYGKNWNYKDCLVYDGSLGVYDMNANEMDYLFKIVEYFVTGEKIDCGVLFEVARIIDGRLSKVKRNDLRGVYDAVTEFSYTDNASYILVYDYGFIVVFLDSTVKWYAFKDLGVAFGYKDSNGEYNKLILVNEYSTDGLQIDSTISPMIVKVLRKVKVKFKNVV